MSTSQNKFYITTPIYYVNDEPHIGSAYTTVAADILARYHRMIGEKVFFLTGTDEHGAKIEEKAKQAGMEPQKFADSIAAKFEFAWDELNISNDNFIRTTDSKHKKAVQNVLQSLYDKGDIYKDKHEGLYCVGCEQYKSEKDLVDGKCPDHKKKPENMSEECYMFKLSKYADPIRKKIEKDEYRISPPERKNEILSFYKEGLKDIAFSRKKVKWGIPLPWDKSHTAYVWADAFLNYLTGIGWDGHFLKTSPQPSPSQGEGANVSPPYQGWGRGRLEFWPVDLHLTSKDILRVHATIWPAMLLALGLPLPKQLFIHGFFLVDGQKMSKSLGNVIRPAELVKKYGVDGARYLLMSATPFGHDGDVGWDKFDEKYNADLANGLGNLVARSITLAEKMRGAGIELRNENQSGIRNKELGIRYENSLKTIKINIAVEEINNEIKFLDGYITENKPWAMIKNKDEKVGGIMYNILERIRIIAWMILPFMPETAEKIWTQLGIDPAEEMKQDFKKAAEWGGLKPGTKIKKGEVLFPRVM
ncbi:methionine--tRNA ligase [Patescibacteria group bacterium]|nr:methionine--tRNA ligase [Candidatus Falkowbacteria bacterium]MBU3906452.1 methionine--tRNA ligase [Patescibacteria group bacterium]MBU4014738.1 methionine--tRNA ligase [Patescibacteria group bacterium]MBU4027088.1 methionine--tRNA ligase [Patescibacteria group bacterium]MBU4073631.1 methionine--tRNA ligase [Patescibacteria group bacterium]